MKGTITFDDNVADVVLDMFFLQANDAGFIINTNSGKCALGLDGKPVARKDFAGIVNTPDGIRLVRKDIVDLIHLSDIMEK